MRQWLMVLAIAVLILAGARRVGAQAYQQEYQSAMVAYRQYQARFERDRQLYQSGSGTSFTTLLASANEAFVARQQAAYSYTRYLRGLVENYVTDVQVRAELVVKLDQQAEAIRAMTVNFDNLSTWAQADSEATAILAALNETAYQSFAEIYYAQLKQIIDEYVTIYQSQNQRILSEATSQIERQGKRATLEETERTLLNLQAQIDTMRPDFNFVNSQPSYVSWRDKMDSIFALTETSLKAYASLE